MLAAGRNEQYYQEQDSLHDNLGFGGMVFITGCFLFRGCAEMLPLGLRACLIGEADRYPKYVGHFIASVLILI